MSSSDRPDVDDDARRVSRETVEVPAVATRVFGGNVGRAVRYAQLLTGTGVARGVLGRGEIERIWDRHLLNCAVIESVIPPGATVCDVGSGGGLPGIVVSLIRPDLDVTLLEPRRGRVTFLQEAVALLGLDRCHPVQERAETHGVRYDVVVARAVAELGDLVRLAVPLCRAGGSIVAIKGDRAEAEFRAAGVELERAGVVAAGISDLGVGIVDPATRVVAMTVGTPAGGGGRSGAARRRSRRARGRG